MTEQSGCLQRTRMMNLLTILVVIIGVVAIGIMLALWRTSALFHPTRLPLTTTPTDYGIPGWTEVAFTTEDGLRLDGWFVPPGPDTDGATIITVHGIGNNRSGMLPLAAPLIAEGYGALFFDLRNHGTSEGEVTTLGYLETLDVEAALDFVRQQPGVNADRVGLLAHSLGTAPSLLVAARDGNVRATATMSAFTSIEDNIAEGIHKFTGLPAVPFAPMVIAFGENETGANLGDVRPIDEVANITPGALLFIHGESDPLLNPDNSERLYEAAQEPKELYLVPGGTHNNYIVNPSAELVGRLLAFMDSYLRG